MINLFKYNPIVAFLSLLVRVLISAFAHLIPSLKSLNFSKFFLMVTFSVQDGHIDIQTSCSISSNATTIATNHYSSQSIFGKEMVDAQTLINTLGTWPTNGDYHNPFKPSFAKITHAGIKRNIMGCCYELDKW